MENFEMTHDVHGEANTSEPTQTADPEAVEFLLVISRRYAPISAKKFLQLINEALPDILHADSLDAEKAVADSLGRRWGAWTEPVCNQLLFGPIVRELLHFTPPQRTRILDSALARIDPAAEMQEHLSDLQGSFATAVATLDPKAKAAYKVLEMILYVFDNYNYEVAQRVREDLDDASIEPLRHDPHWRQLLKLHDLAAALYQAM